MIDNEYVKTHYKISNQDPYKCNLMHIPANYLEPTEAGANEMNKLIRWCLDKDIPKLEKTKSGGIKIGEKGLGFSLTSNSLGVELIYNAAFQFKVQFRHLNCNIEGFGHHLTGGQCFNMFKDLCKKYDIDIMSMWDSEKGKEIKKEIESPIRWLNPIYKDKTIEHVYHIDGNNMWFGKMIEEFPIFKKPVAELYREKCTTDDLNRKQDIKDLFTHTLGYCQSLNAKKMNAGLAQLAKAGINGCNAIIKKLVNYYGDRVIAINTDGLWLTCRPNIDHLGTDIGEFKLDHKDCKFRAISANKYEYIENGKYKAVVSGLTQLDKKVNRADWSWGDIYKTDCRVYGYELDKKTSQLNYVEVDDQGE